MKKPINRQLIAALILAVLAGTHCGPPYEVEPHYEGLLKLTVDHHTKTEHEGFHPFSQRITEQAYRVGSSLDVQVASVYGNRRQAQEIVSLQIEGDPIVAYERTGNLEFRLDFLEAGETSLYLEVRKADGEIYYQTEELVLRPAHALLTGHRCDGKSTHGIYPPDRDIRIGYVYFNDDDDIPLAGYGEHPVEVEGSAELSLPSPSSDLLYWDLSTGSELGEAQLSSTIDEGGLSFEIANLEDANGLTLVGAEKLEAMAVGGRQVAHILPALDGYPICFADAHAMARSLTPEICHVRERMTQPRETPQPYGRGRIEVERFSEGICVFEATIVVDWEEEGLVEIFEVSGS